jgi:RNA polymerase sigma factor (TIGR02999 family)
MQSSDQDITNWLNTQNQVPGLPSRGVNNALFILLYEDLHRVASGHMRKEHAGHTLSATALTHEAWFRMGEQSRTQWASRAHFLAIASTIMRRILVHHAVAKRAQKRDVELVSITASEADLGLPLDHDLVAVHDALLAFEALDPRAAKVVEMRFFGGMENAEIAEALQISVPTVKREWSVARAWLMREIQSGR